MLDDKYVTMEIEKVKHIALVAHDGKKRELVDWCEKNKAPVPSTNYRYCDGQIEVPDRADERGGLQPVVKCFANGQKCIHVKAGLERRS